MRLLLAAVGAAVALCSPAVLAAQAPSELESASQLTPDPGKGDSWTYRNPDAALNKYQRFLVQPTQVSADPAARWGSSSPEQRQKYAAYMTKALVREVAKGYQIVDRPGPGVAILRLTLLGVNDTVPLIATATRLTPMGFAVNGVKSLAGRKGSMTGSVHAALEISDAQSGDLLFAAVRQRAPVALDITSTLSTEKTVEAVADDIAKSVRAGIDKANGR